MLWKSRFFLLICDHKNIYLGFRCFDTEPQKIKASVSKRDNPGNDDWIAFCLDTFNDELGAYFFLVNPLGIQTDGTLNADANAGVTLDMVWTSAGRLTTDGYAAEMAIPFKSLRFPSKKNLVMGFKMARNISRKSEEVDFPEYRPERGAALAQFQKIELSGIKKKQLLEMLPATTVSKKHLHQEGSLASPGANKEFSLTSKFGISSGLILDATYHPDFSQVETDAGQIDVNLRYSLYYPEKRSFFMEGQEWFAFAASPEQLPLRTVVHTRNIVQPSVGMKLTGKISSKDIISAIYAQDDYDRKAHVSLPRYLRRLKNDSYLGGFYTGRNMSGAYNYVVGSAGRLRINNHSYFEFHGFKSYSKATEAVQDVSGSAIVIKTYTRLSDAEKSQCGIFASNYGEAGAIKYFGKQHNLPEPICFNGSFLLWAPDSIHINSYTLIYVNRDTG